MKNKENKVLGILGYPLKQSPRSARAVLALPGVGGLCEGGRAQEWLGPRLVGMGEPGRYGGLPPMSCKVDGCFYSVLFLNQGLQGTTETFPFFPHQFSFKTLKFSFKTH